MFAIAFDLDYDTTAIENPVGVRRAYRDIEAVMTRYGFGRIQQSVSVNRGGELISVTLVMIALKALPWFPVCVKDIRAFRVENWSDFTEFFKDEGANR